MSKKERNPDPDPAVAEREAQEAVRPTPATVGTPAATLERFPDDHTARAAQRRQEEDPDGLLQGPGRELSRGEEPVRDLGRAVQRAGERDSQVPFHQLPVEHRTQTPNPESVTRQPAFVPVGSPNVALRPDLPRLGNNVPAGETQPGIPAPGEAERAVDRDTLERLQAGRAANPESVTVADGIIRVGDRLVLPLAGTGVEFHEGRGATLSVYGKDHELDEPAAEQLKRALRPR